MAQHDLVGLVGVALVLWAYVGLQLRQLDAESALYSALNGLGSAGILYSLIFDFNLASAVANIIWVLVSVYALARAWRSPRPAA